MKKSILYYFIPVLLAFLAAVTCFGAGDDKDVVSIKGTVRHFSYEAGYYGIKGDDGREYKPLNLTAGFMIEGLKVKLRARVITPRLLFKPQCIPIEIIDIERATDDEVAGKRVYADPSKTITVRVGQTFIINLKANPTTGYLWELAAPVDKNVIEYESSRYMKDDKTGILIVGAEGEERWTFKAVGAGEATIALRYVRPWEKDALPAKKASFRVIIR